MQQGKQMKIQDAKTIMQSNIVMLKIANNPDLTLQVKMMETLMSHIYKLENENSELKAKNMIKEMPGGEG